MKNREGRRLVMINRRSFIQGIGGTATSFPMPALAGSLIPAQKELRLGLDASSSMYPSSSLDEARWKIQRDGHVAALRDPEIQHLLILGRVLVRAFLWSSGNRGFKELHAARNLIRTEADAERVAQVIAEETPSVQLTNATEHGMLLQRCRQLAAEAPRVVIDVSSDEEPTEDQVLLCQNERDTLAHQGWTVNTLGIGMTAYEGLRYSVQTPDGFSRLVNSWADYPVGIRQKLALELM
ncbi:MAG: DUF1194 domain-containing protein [Candidatus Paceibacterota bacterium]